MAIRYGSTGGDSFVINKKKEQDSFAKGGYKVIEKAKSQSTVPTPMRYRDFGREDEDEKRSRSKVSTPMRYRTYEKPKEKDRSIRTPAGWNFNRAVDSFTKPSFSSYTDKYRNLGGSPTGFLSTPAAQQQRITASPTGFLSTPKVNIPREALTRPPVQPQVPREALTRPPNARTPVPREALTRPPNRREGLPATAMEKQFAYPDWFGYQFGPPPPPDYGKTTQQPQQEYPGWWYGWGGGGGGWGGGGYSPRTPAWFQDLIYWRI